MSTKVALIAPMLTGKSHYTSGSPYPQHNGWQVVDSDGLVSQADLFTALGRPRSDWDHAKWALWNAARTTQIQAGLRRMRTGNLIILVHSRQDAEALGLYVIGIVMIPLAEFLMRQNLNPDRASLAGRNRAEILSDPEFVTFPLYSSIERAITAFTTSSKGKL